jgi:hypothetical protein
MSIRNLTAQLQKETAEQQRAQKFRSARAIKEPEKKQGLAKQTSFMLGIGNRSETPQPAASEAFIQNQTTRPKTGIKEREPQKAYGIPGGIAARFGRDALKESATPSQPIITTETIPEPVQELSPEEETETTSEVEEAPEQERATEQEEAARITIELQSH